MKLLKFGGSSVADASRINKVIDILKKKKENGDEFSVVFSALGGTTDKLIQLANAAADGDPAYESVYNEIKQRHHNVINELGITEADPSFIDYINETFKELKNIAHGVFLLKELTKKSFAYLQSFGEVLSCKIIARKLQLVGLKATFTDARTVIITNNCFLKARVNFEATNELINKNFVDESMIYVITGFVGSTVNNETTTLGRGGSDYTAAIIGAAIDAEEIEIWTDVDGIMTADPRKVSDATPIKAVTYHEAMELSHFGAKVLHPPTMLPALNKNIKIRIKNTFNPEFRGSVVLEREPSVKFNLKGITSIDDVSVLRIFGSGMTGIERITARIFNVLADNHISVLLITQSSSGNSLTVAVNPDEAVKACKKIEEEFRYELLEKELTSVDILENKSIIATVGEDMIDTPGVSGKVCDALGRNGINIDAISLGSSQLNLSIIISKDQLKKALNVLHDRLNLSEEKVVNIFMAGPGLVGSEFLNQVLTRNETIKKSFRIRFNIVGIINSKKMIVNEKGVDLNSWKNLLNDAGKTADTKEYIESVINANMSNSVFVDCTANATFVSYYKTLLEHNISVVTPNKVANSGNQEYYKELNETARHKNVKFRYAANVGAGLPFISTVKDMYTTGDEITKIEALLSGSLGFIFSEFNKGGKFSDIVLKAKGNGFSEPDPRDDLGGLDAARKILILAREAGFNLELKDVDVENLVPEELRNISTEEFLSKIEQLNLHFDEKREQAKAENKKLSYVASFENNEAKVKLMSIDESHPFYYAEESESVISIYSRVYKEIPVTVKGQGAGAYVTAASVFADVLRIFNYLG